VCVSSLSRARSLSLARTRATKVSLRPRTQTSATRLWRTAGHTTIYQQPCHHTVVLNPGPLDRDFERSLESDYIRCIITQTDGLRSLTIRLRT
jgi:hypothetical protein